MLWWPSRPAALEVPQPIRRHRLPRGAAELLEWSETEDETVVPPASKRQRTDETASGDGQQQIDGPTKEPRTPQQWVLRAADTSQIIDLDDYKRSAGAHIHSDVQGLLT